MLGPCCDMQAQELIVDRRGELNFILAASMADGMQQIVHIMQIGKPRTTFFH